MKSTFFTTFCVVPFALLAASACATRTFGEKGKIKEFAAGRESARFASVVERQRAAGVADEMNDPQAPPIPSPSQLKLAIEDIRYFIGGNPRLSGYYKDGNRREACWLNPLGDKFSNAQVTFYCEMPFEFRFCNSLAIKKVDGNSELDGLGKIQRKWKRYEQCRVGMGTVYDSVIGGFNFDKFRREDYKASGFVSAAYYWAFLRAKDYESILKTEDPSFDPTSLVSFPKPGFDRSDKTRFRDIALSTNDLYFQWIFSPIRNRITPVMKILKLDDEFGLALDELEEAVAQELGKLGEKYVAPKFAPGQGTPK